MSSALLNQPSNTTSTTSVEGNTVTIKETDQTPEETDQTASMPEPVPMTQTAFDRVDYPMPRPDDPEATPLAEIDAGREIDVVIAPEVDDDGTDAFDGNPKTGPSELDDEEVDLRDRPTGVASEATPLLGVTGVYEERWNAIQTAFVDEPRHAVQNADGLVAEAMEDLARSIASHRGALVSQWCQDEDVDTEHLRLTFQEYRTFLHGLLSA
jgi:hypothetical protein